MKAGAAAPGLGPAVALIPVFHAGRLEDVVDGALAFLDGVLLVDDGAPGDVGALAVKLAASDPRISLLALGSNHGKGHALAAGVEALLEDGHDAILTLDADGQHPPEMIPAFLEAARDADVVIGRRRDRRAGGMPLVRRIANATSSRALSLTARRRLPDTQCGMRLLRASALRRVPLEPGRFETETRHLKALLRANATIAWVDIPTIYAGEPSSFRTLRDAARIGRAIVSRSA